MNNRIAETVLLQMHKRQHVGVRTPSTSSEQTVKAKGSRWLLQCAGGKMPLEEFVASIVNLSDLKSCTLNTLRRECPESSAA